MYGDRPGSPSRRDDRSDGWEPQTGPAEPERQEFAPTTSPEDVRVAGASLDEPGRDPQTGPQAPQAGRGHKNASGRMPLRIAAVAGAAVVLVGAGAVAAFATAGDGGKTAAAKPTPQADAPRRPDPRVLEEQRRRLNLERADQAARKDAGRRLELQPKGRKPTPKPTRTPGAYAGNPVPAGEAQRIAKAMLPSFGFDPDTQFGCLVKLWDKESGWRTTAQNPTSGAYGIPQALPGEKMASAGDDWRTNPRTQIKWGLGYIKDRYGSPCEAWAHSQSVGWY